MAEEKGRQAKQLKTAIVILLALLLLSAGALAGRVVSLNFFKDDPSVSVAPNNFLGEAPAAFAVASVERAGGAKNAPSPSGSSAAPGGSAEAIKKEAAVIELYKGQPSDNEKFQVANMLPGDCETKYFAVKVSHRADAAVSFNAAVTQQTKNLAEVLHIKVTRLENGKVLYDGAFAGMNGDGYGETFAATQSTETVAYYKIEVSLPTSVGNEYQAAKLLADFTWTVKDAEILEPPKTGDNSNLPLYFLMMCCALAMLLLLLFFRRGKKEDRYAATE